ncbi:PD-(D/E)XK nuclease family protein [Emergencia sp. JLR.KK010]|uniref:PD-(D/E)XK nuclease family protein n=1 Tax=Emergencia sp. JLR.KK010 TaxID=3114296 RepID=UPI0030CB8D47
MLQIFYGRESIEKEKFIYEDIQKNPGRTIVIVPDQYTLEAEKQAFLFLHAESMMDVEIIGMSRLGSRLLSQQGGGSKTFIDKYGRHMLLTQIAGKCEDKLQVFKGSLRKPAFIEMTNNFISEMKQYNVNPQDLTELSQALSEESVLRAKLADLVLIFSEYQKKIKDRYTDSEDYIDLYMSKIRSSAWISESRIWVYGFDSFAPKALDVLGNLIATAKEVSVFLTCDKGCRDEELFLLPEIVMRNLRKQAEAYDMECRMQQIAEGTGFDAVRNPAISHIEKEFYAVGQRTGDFPLLKEQDAPIVLVQAANMYSEAESAASYILHLIRDKGFRYRDIVVICNDQTVRGSIIGRVFEEWDLPVFDDKKRSVLSSPIAIFAVGLLETVVYNYRSSDIFKVLKTGFSSLSDEEIERLENYSIQYRIKGNMWLAPFVKGQMEYGDDGLEELNAIREKAMELFAGLKMICDETVSMGDFVCRYYDFLIEDCGLGVRIAELLRVQEEQGLFDLAEETAQIWGQMVGLLDQIAELAGEEQFRRKDFVELLIAGLSQLEIGVLPPTADDILMGTMQRTRSGQVKAVVIIGANEGLLPANASSEGLFSMEELEFFAEEGKEICKVEKIRVMEEQLAIYRNLSKASDYLWISYSASDGDGKESRPSEIIDTLRRLFPNLTVQTDVVSSGDLDAVVGGRVNTLRHLTEALLSVRRGEKIDSRWKAVIHWYQCHEPESLQRVSEGLSFTNAQKDISPELASLLYKKEMNLPMTLSPSRLEKFSRCPFSHFIAYGLRPQERRIYEASSREIGDIYHRCLMEVSRKLTVEDRWDSISEDECRSFVSDIAKLEAANYREGIFDFGNEERYKTRRIEDTCFHVCWALVEQVRAGNIKKSLYEVPFGRERSIAPIEVNLGSSTVYIEGKIDRLDILEGDRVKIVDYKTGKETFNEKEARAGYRLQLMLYLKAAQEKVRRPAGVFYFHIADQRVDLTGTEREKFFEKISKEMRKFFRLSGIMVDSGAVIEDIAGEFSGFSDILPLRRNTAGEVSATSEGFLLSDEQFEQLQADVDVQIEKLCRQLSDGRIAIHPKKTEKQSPCTYCDYKGICRFDLSFPGCNYEVIK